MAAVRDLEDRLRRLREDLQSVDLLERLVTDLNEVCLNEVTDKEIEWVNSLLFDQQLGIVQFLHQNVTLFPEIKSKLLVFLCKYVEQTGKKVQPYVVDLKNICLSSYNQDRAAKVKNASIILLVQVFKVAAPQQLPDLNIESLFEKFYREMSQVTRIVCTVRANIYRLLGTISEFCPEYMQNHAEELVDVFLKSLKEELNTKTRKPELTIIAASLDGLNSCLVKHTPFADEDSPQIYDLLNCARKAINPDIPLTRYEMTKAGLNFFARHCGLFSHFLIDVYEDMYDMLLKWCQHKNRDISRLGQYAMEGFITQMSKTLTLDERGVDSRRQSSIFQFFVKKFHAIMVNNDASRNDVSLAVRSYGVLAAPCKKFLSIKEVHVMFREMLCHCRQQFEGDNDEGKDQLYSLPSYLEALASIVRELDYVSEESLLTLEHLLVLILEYYPHVYVRRQFLSVKAAVKLLLALMPMETVFREFLSRTVYQGLIRTCSHAVALESESSADSVPGANVKKQISYKNYMDLWSGLLNSANNKELASIGYSIKERNRLTELLYDEMMSSILKILKKLDLSIAPGASTIQQASSDENSSFQNTSTTDSVESADPVFGVKPSRLQDQLIFMNLVSFSSDFLPQNNFRMFERWVLQFTESVVTLSSSNPLVSGFYRLLAVGMKLTNRLNYFKDINVAYVNIVEVQDRNMKERIICFILMKKFTKEVLVQMKQYRDHLLASCLVLVLSLPSKLIENQLKDLVPAAQLALSLGVSYLPLANIGMDALEYWSKVLPAEVLHPVYPDILPYLDSYLRSSEKDVDDVSMDSSANATKGRDTVGKKIVLHAAKKKTHKVGYMSELGQIKLRIVEYLGKIGGSVNRNLLANTQKEISEHAVVWDVEKHLKFDFPFMDMRPTIYFDSFLPHLLELATKSSDRQTKSAACEFLHSLVVFSLGRAAQQTRQSTQRVPMEKLYRKLFPALLQLACDVELVSKQLFEPLVFQLIHWFTKNKFENEESMSLLDVIYDGITQPTDTALRDFSARCLSEYLKWSIKQLSKKRLEYKPENVKSVLKRMYKYALHPNPFKRLGAALAFNNFYTIFREYDTLVDQFIFNILVHFVKCLAISHADEKSLGVHIQCNKVLDHLERIIMKKSDLLMKPNSQRSEPSFWSQVTLDCAVRWLVRQCGRPQTECRHACMKLVYKLAPHIHGIKLTKDYFNFFLKREGPKYFLVRFEGGGDGAMPGESLIDCPTLETKETFNLQETCQWFESILAALECYTWVFDNDLLTPAEMFLDIGPDSTKIFDALLYFLEHVAFFGAREMADKMEGDLVETLFFTPRELEKFNRTKCSVMIRLFNFLTIVLKQCYRLKDYSFIPEKLWSKYLWKMLTDCILSPTRLGFDLGDVETMNNLPKEMKQILKDALEFLPSDNLDSLKEYVHNDLKERRNLVKLLPIDLKEDQLNFYDLQQIMCGYSLLSQAGFLKRIDSGHLAEKLFLNVFRAIVSKSSNGQLESVPLTPMEFELTKTMLDLALKLPLTLKTYLDALFDKSPLGSPRQGAQTHGELYFTLYKQQMINYIIQKMTDVVPFLTKKANVDGHFIGHILIETLEHMSRDTALRKGSGIQICTILLNSWNLFECWWKNDASVDHQTMALTFLRKLLLIDSKVLSDVNQPVCGQIHQMFYSLLKDGKTNLAFKSSVLEILPFLCVTAEPFNSQLKECLESFVADRFPLSSQEFSPHSTRYNDYISALDKILMALNLTSSPMLLKLLINIFCRDENHIHEAAILKVLDSFMKRVRSCDQKQFAEIPFNLAMKIESCPVKVLKSAILKVCLPILRVMSKAALIEFFSSNISHIMTILESKIIKWSEDKLERQLTEQLCCLQILQVMYFSLEKDEVNSKSSVINKAYCEGKDLMGNELTKTITKISHKIKGEDMRGETMCLEVYRQLHCAAYNLLISIISCTQTEQKFYTAFLFSENEAKCEFLWDNLVDKNRTYTFPVEIQSNLEKKNAFVSVRDEIRKKTLETKSNQLSASYHLSSVYLADSSLSADLGRYDFTSSVGHLSFIPATESESSQDEQQIASDITTRPEDTENADTDTGYALLEMDEINQHEVMAPLVALLRHMRDSNITPKVPTGEKSSEMPPWMLKLHKKLTDNSTHVNIKFFIVKLILNTAEIFKPYASFWLTPLCELVVCGALGYNSLSYFITDIIITLLRWHKIAIPQDSIEDRALVSQLLNFIFSNVYHETRSVFRENLDMLKTLLECWKERIDIPYAIIYNKMAEFDVKAMESMTGVQLIGVILSCQMAPYENIDEVSQNQFFSCLGKGLQHNYKAVYTATAEVFGLVLKYYFEQKPDLVESIFEIVLPAISQMQIEQPDKFIICLHKIQQHYSQASKQFTSLLLFLLPKVHGVFRAQCLEIIQGSLANHDNIFLELKSKGLVSFLSHRDEATQLVALRIVKSILPKLEPRDVEGLLPTINDLILHPSFECRKLTFDLLMWIYDNYNEEETSESNNILVLTKDALLRGLVDEDIRCRLLVQNFWSSNDRLPEGTLDRVAAILKLMYSPKTENRFLNYATNLILEMTSKSPEYTRKIYEFPLSECKFQDYKLQSSWQQRHATMTPFFISSQMLGDNAEETMETDHIQATVDESHKDYTPTQDIRAPFNWLTQSSLDTFSETNMDVDVSSSLLFTQGSTASSAGRAPLLTRKKPGADFGKSKLGTKGSASPSDQKHDEAGSSHSDRFRLRRRFLKDHESKHIFYAKKQIRKAEMREQVRKDKQSKREHQVTIYRKYRTGELPDIQIEYSSIIAPLQGVAERDSTIAKLLFSSLFKGIFEKISTIKSEEESQTFKTEMCENFQKILNSSTEYFPPFIGCMLNILYNMKTEIPVSTDIIVRSALASNLQSLGIVLLEERLIQTSGDSSELKTKRPRRVHLEPSVNMMTWIDLARLYKANKEHDSLLGIFKEKISSKETSQKAISAEICGDYSLAVQQYKKALLNLEDDSENHFETETIFWSSCLIQCLENLKKWDRIESECMKRTSPKGNDMNDFWENNEYQDFYLSPYIRSKLKLMQKGDSSQQTLLTFIDNAMTIPERRDLLENQFCKDLSMMFLLQENYSRAHHYIQNAMNGFLEDWQSTDVLMNPSRVYMLQNLQAMIEIQEFLKFTSEEKNFNSLDNVKHLFDVWVKRIPSVLEDSVTVWDDVIMNRLSYMDKFRAMRKKNLSGELMSSEEADCFLQNKMKLQLLIVHNSCAQNNFKLALKMLEQTHMADENPLTESLKLEWSHLYAETRQKKASLDTNWDTTTFSDFMTVFKNLGKQDSSRLLGEQPQLKRKHNILYAQCYELLASRFLQQKDLNFKNLPYKTKIKILNSVSAKEEIPETTLIENLIKCGYERIKKGVSPLSKGDDAASPSSTVSRGRACLAVAKYCDTFLKALEEGTLKSESAVRTFPETMVKSLFCAIQYDILEARQRFCRLLQLLEQHADTMDIFLTEADKTPCWMFLMWINQIVSLVDKPESKAIQSILLKMTHLYPQAVVYSFRTSQEGFKFSATPQGKENEMFVKKLDDLLGAEKLNSVHHFIKSLEQLSDPVSIFKDWHTEMMSILSKAKPDKQKAVDAYLTFYDKVLNNCKTRRGSQSSQNQFDDSGPYRQRFAKEFRSEFESVFGKNGEKLKSMDPQDFKQCASKLTTKIKKFVEINPESLQEFSSWMANFDPLQNNLEIPGQYHGLTKPLPEYHKKIAGFNEKVVTFKSIRKPRKITILADDEKEYAYVVKGGEDLRQDQRIELLFEKMNQIFREDSACKSRNLNLKTYQVIPMTTRIGMIEFLDNVKTLKEILTEVLIQRDQMKSYENALIKYMEMFQEFGGAQVKMYMSVYKMCNRTKVQQNFNNAVGSVPWNLLRDSFLGMSTSPEAFHVLRTNFALSHAVICVCHYMLGVGDRHLSNMMIHQGTGQMIGIDFGHAFGSATQFLPIPELMPFRLTNQILNVFLPHKTKGIFERTMTCALNALRSDKELLLLLMDIFIKEPSVDWLHNALKEQQASGIADEEDLTWYPKEKIDFVKRKFLGENPCYITRDEVKLGHSNKPEYQNLELVVLGDKEYNIRAKLPQKSLTCDEQVSALIDQATDPAILGRTYRGWEPYI